MKLTAKASSPRSPCSTANRSFFRRRHAGLRLPASAGAAARSCAHGSCQYRHGGATRRLLLGSADGARRRGGAHLAKKALGRVANGEDPQADKLDRRGKDRLIRSRPSSPIILAMKQREVRRALTPSRALSSPPYFKPLHSLALDQIAPQGRCQPVEPHHLRERLDRGLPRPRAALSALFSWALAHGLGEANPVVGTIEPTEASRASGCSRTRAGRDLAGMRRRRSRPLHQAADPDRVPAAEIGGLCLVANLIFERGVWTLPAAAQQERSRAYAAADAACSPSSRRCRGWRAAISFSAPRADGFTGWSRGKAALDERSRGERLDDARHPAVRRHAGRHRHAPHIIEQILNHQSGHKAGPAGIYNRSSYEREVRAALALWEDHIRTLVEGGERKIFHCRARHLDAGTGRW